MAFTRETHNFLVPNTDVCFYCFATDLELMAHHYESNRVTQFYSFLIWAKFPNAE